MGIEQWQGPLVSDALIQNLNRKFIDKVEIEREETGCPHKDCPHCHPPQATTLTIKEALEAMRTADEWQMREQEKLQERIDEMIRKAMLEQLDRKTKAVLLATPPQNLVSTYPDLTHLIEPDPRSIVKIVS